MLLYEILVKCLLMRRPDKLSKKMIPAAYAEGDREIPTANIIVSVK